MQINKVLTNLGTMLARLIGEDVKLQMRLNPDIGRTRVDPGQIEQVIMNLAINARDAMPRGGTLTIESHDVAYEDIIEQNRKAMKPARYIAITVRDTGHGMTQETLEHIFDPFFTTKETGKGTGLGLSTAYGIVKQSEGYIFAQSTPGLDTTFTIYLPAVNGSAEEHDGAKPLQEASLKRADNRGAEVIFLVEDEESLRKLACKILEKSGYTVMSAADGKKALEMARATRGARVDLLVTDVIMPEMSGRDISAELRKIYPELKVLYMSGYTDDVIASHGVLDEGVFFLQKPFPPAEFEDRIREVLDSG